MARKQFGLGCLTAFLLIFVVGFGGFGLYGLRQELRVRNFRPVTGVITHSELGISRGRDSTTYYPDIRFRYIVNGRVYETGRYRIQRISSSGRHGKLQIVRQYPVGAEVRAWYDPQEPSAAVIDRSFSVFPLIFLGAGVVVLGVIVGIWVVQFRGRAVSPAAAPTGPLPAVIGAGRRQHNVALPRFGGVAGQVSSLAGILIFCLIWNGIAWSVASAVWFFNKNPPPIWARAILVMFMAVGVLTAVKVVMMLMARTKLGRPELIVSVHPLWLGERFTVRCRQRAKRAMHVQAVTARLICREFATCRSGKNTTTATHDVHQEQHTLLEHLSAEPGEMIEGRLQLRIPEDGMHSFRASFNRIIWLLELRTAVENWPDYSDTFELQVAAARAPSQEYA